MKNIRVLILVGLLFLVLILVGLLFLPAHFAGAAPKAASPAGTAPAETATVAGLPVRVRGGNVVIDAGTENEPAPIYNGSVESVDFEKDSLTPFLAVLKAYPNARTVKLSWFELITMSGTGADVLYDRVTHTVTVDFNYGGGMDPMTYGRVQFTHVQESVFAAILRAHPRGLQESDAPAWGGFQFLYQRRYGCRVLAPRRHRRRHLAG